MKVPDKRTTGLLAGLFLASAWLPLYAESKVTNFAKPSVTVARVALDQPKKAVESKADLAIVMTGTTDAVWNGGKGDKEQYRKSINSILSQFKQAGISVVLITIPEVNETLLFARQPKEAYGERTPNRRISDENEVLKTIANEQNIQLVDFAAECAKYDINGKDAFVRNPANKGGKDGIRLIPAGFQRLAEMTAAVIKEKNLPYSNIACLGDDIVYGTTSPDAGKSVGKNFPGYLNQLLNNESSRK